MMLIEAQTGLYTRDAVPETYTTVTFYVGGEPVGDVAYDATAVPPSPCQSAPYGQCYLGCPTVVINGQSVDGTCFGIALIQPPAEFCACYYPKVKSFVASGVTVPTTVAAGIDGAPPLLAGEEGGDQGLVAEWDETNNYLEIAIGPSALEGSTWSSLKAIWRQDASRRPGTGT